MKITHFFLRPPATPCEVFSHKTSQNISKYFKTLQDDALLQNFFSHRPSSRDFFLIKSPGKSPGESLSGFGDNLQPGRDTAPRLEARAILNRFVHENGRPFGRLVAGKAWHAWQEIPRTMQREKGSAAVQPFHQPSEDTARRTSLGNPCAMHHGIRGRISSAIGDDSYAAGHSISHHISR